MQHKTLISTVVAKRRSNPTQLMDLKRKQTNKQTSKQRHSTTQRRSVVTHSIGGQMSSVSFSACISAMQLKATQHNTDKETNNQKTHNKHTNKTKKIKQTNKQTPQTNKEDNTTIFIFRSVPTSSDSIVAILFLIIIIREDDFSDNYLRYCQLSSSSSSSYSSSIVRMM